MDILFYCRRISSFAFYEKTEQYLNSFFLLGHLTVSTPALNIVIEFMLISWGVSSPFMIRYVSSGTATE